MSKLYRTGLQNYEKYETEYVGVKLGFHRPPPVKNLRLSWTFYFEDFEWKTKRYISLTGKSRGSQSSERMFHFDAKYEQWVYVDEARNEFRPRSYYRKGAYEYLSTNPLENIEIQQYDFITPIVDGYEGFKLGRKKLDIVRIEIEQKQEYIPNAVNGYITINVLEVIMSKDGSVLSAIKNKIFRETDS